MAASAARAAEAASAEAWAYGMGGREEGESERGGGMEAKKKRAGDATHSCLLPFLLRHGDVTPRSVQSTFVTSKTREFPPPHDRPSTTLSSLEKKGKKSARARTRTRGHAKKNPTPFSLSFFLSLPLPSVHRRGQRPGRGRGAAVMKRGRPGRPPQWKRGGGLTAPQAARRPGRRSRPRPGSPPPGPARICA